MLTVDFEAFRAHDMPMWSWAMRRWAELAREFAMPFSFFLSIEDAVALRATDRAQYREFLERCADLRDSRAKFHPHNHRVFDLDTGRRPSDGRVQSKKVPGYRNQASMFYDVHHRNGIDVIEWLGQVDAAFVRFLEEASIPRARRHVFRAGGFDYGSAPQEQALYLEGLARNGFMIDSSATYGVYGTRSMRVGLPFGKNCQRLWYGVYEVAPCWALDCGADITSRATVGSALRLAANPELWFNRESEGVFVVLLHFDHLFHRRVRGGYDLFRVHDREVVEQRMRRAFGVLDSLRKTLRLTPASFDELPLPADDFVHPFPSRPGERKVRIA